MNIEHRTSNIEFLILKDEETGIGYSTKTARKSKVDSIYSVV